MPKITTTTIILALLLLSSAPVFPQADLSSEVKDPELDQEIAWLKAETYVITASRVRENIKKAPASISVITDKQIRQMGAKHLADVLRTVPGIQLWSHFNGTILSNVRRGNGESKVLILLNGNSLDSTFYGGVTWINDTLVLDNVKRIEIIRGPGSALYGANAYSGVINVITKEAEDIDGLELTASGGSYDTQEYNLLYGKTFSDLEIAFNFNYFKTHGFRGYIEEDRQTQFDQLWAPLGFPPASLAPGRMASNDEKYDAQLTLKYKGFTFDGKYIDRERDLPVGWQGALSHNSITSDKNYYLNLGYKTNIWEWADLSGKLYGNFEDIYWPAAQIFPPGYVTLTAPPPPLLSEIMPDGMIAGASFKTYRIGVEIQSIYKISDSNTVVTGATYEELKQYDFMRRGNYWPTGNPGVVNPLPLVQEWPEAFTEDTEKINFKAVFLEDIWDITDSLRITTGVRYDHYSNFGGEVSPRVGLTWEFKEGCELKLLYGHAFRAPNFLELYSYAIGNPDLDPETKNTYEVSFGAEFNPSLSARITGYYSKAKDIITQNATSPFIFVNVGEARSRGFEVEMKYDFGRGTYFAGNYNYGTTPIADTPTVDSVDWTTPRHKGNIMANIRLSRYLNFFTNCHFQDDFPRHYDDNRDEMSGFEIVDATLIARKFLKGYEGLELRGSVYNLFDKEYASPQDTRLPNDLPMPGRNYLLEMKYSF